MKKVYLIDDDDIFVFLTKKTILKVSSNVDVEVFSDGYQAITHLRGIAQDKELLPDLIFLDLNMPIMDGYEAAMSIRNLKDQKKSNVTIIALTASVALDVRSKVAAAGIDDFMSKPFKTAELRQKLEEVITKKGISFYPL